MTGKARWTPPGCRSFRPSRQSRVDFHLQSRPPLAVFLLLFVDLLKRHLCNVLQHAVGLINYRVPIFRQGVSSPAQSEPDNIFNASGRVTGRHRLRGTRVFRYADDMDRGFAGIRPGILLFLNAEYRGDPLSNRITIPVSPFIPARGGSPEAKIYDLSAVACELKGKVVQFFLEE
ncbi:hypothetical protein [Rhizobium terrae]|uniref:hypothetical protein n=1 Tax=Rhizobium terrae TaxID=2171756 RepID=UPI0013C31E9E|nr:hypothetical protein [Rhizobium terrae]